MSEVLSYQDIAIRLANEGIPVLVTSRSLATTSEEVRDWLYAALLSGDIVEVPPDDWPPTSVRADRVPANVIRESPGDVMFGCQRTFKLTRLEATLMGVLLRRDEADKQTLHGAIEQQRFTRATRPDSLDPTDPKMVDVIICKLRKKLKPYEVFIKTIWGRGYYIDGASRKIAHELINEPV